MWTSNLSEQMHGGPVLRLQPTQLRAPRWEFEVPVLHETLLMVELEAHEFCVDLHAMSQFILNDLGASLQILRLVGREYGDAADRPSRIEDCIAAMGVQACIEAMSVQSIQQGRPLHAMAELSSHSKQIALRSRQVAEQAVDLDLDQAYFVGLCHCIGSLPAALRWNKSMNRRLDPVSTGLEMAKEWALPDCVVEYFSDLRKGSVISPWLELVRAAHRGAGADGGALASGPAPLGELLWAV